MKNWLINKLRTAIGERVRTLLLNLANRAADWLEGKTAPAPTTPTNPDDMKKDTNPDNSGQFKHPTDTRGQGKVLSWLLFLCIFVSLWFNTASAQTFKTVPTEAYFTARAEDPALRTSTFALPDSTNSPSISGGLFEIGESLLNTISNITFIPAVRIPLDGGKISYLIAGAYPVTDNVVLGGRLDFNNLANGYSIYGGSISCTLQAERQIFGVPVVGFVCQAVEFPLSGRTFSGFTIPGTPADSQDPFPLTSVGLDFKIHSFIWAEGKKALTLGFLVAYETGWKSETQSAIASLPFNYRW